MLAATEGGEDRLGGRARPDRAAGRQRGPSGVMGAVEACGRGWGRRALGVCGATGPVDAAGLATVGLAREMPR